MKKMLLLFVAVLTAGIINAQIPNWNWETWTTHAQEVPTGWITFGKVTKVTGQHGSYAARLQSENGDPGAALYGNPNNGGFRGGTPFAARPDSLIAYLQYNIAAGDSAYVIISMQNSDTAISSNIYTYKGSNTSGFQRVAYKINYSSATVPDTVFVGFTSTDINNADTASWVIVDNVSFSGTATNVPNPDFETWVNTSYDTPDGWISDDPAHNAVVTKATGTDAYSGSASLKLSTVINGTDTMGGHITTTPPNDNHQFGPCFPISSKPDSFTCYAKYMPVNGDSAQINISFFQAGTSIGGGQLTIGGTHSTYTPFSVHLNYGPSSTPDSASMDITTYTSTMGNQNPHGASVLYVDNMNFGAYINAGVATVTANNNINIYPNPAHDKVVIELGNTNITQAAIQIIDVSGKVVLQQNAAVSSGNIQVDMSALTATGIYFVKVNTGTEVLTNKILKD